MARRDKEVINPEEERDAVISEEEATVNVQEKEPENTPDKVEEKPDEKEKEVITAEEPKKAPVIKEKDFIDLKQNAQIKYLKASINYLVGKMSPEEQRVFYVNFPEMR